MGLLWGTRFYHFWGQDKGGFSGLVVLEFLEAIIKKYKGFVDTTVSVQNICGVFVLFPEAYDTESSNSMCFWKLHTLDFFDIHTWHNSEMQVSAFIQQLGEQ